ncbi:MAG: acetyl-CoA C-acyltransferase [Patulibacter minatonensis]
MAKTVILSTARTPIGKLSGGLSSLPATELGAIAIRGALERAGVTGEQIEHVIMGQVLQGGAGQIPSRQAQIAAGIPIEVSSETINKVCASGMRAIALADLHIRAGEVEVAIGGGMESMSQAPHALPGSRNGFRMGPATMIDLMQHDGLTNAFTGKQMYVEATEVGDELNIGREELDEFAALSHTRALAARENGNLPHEIVPVTVPGRKGDTVVEHDEGPREGTTAESLSKLRGLVKDGTHTAGNSPSVNDGAAALVLASEDWAKKNGKQILGEIVGHAQVADDFPYLAKTPAAAAKKALDRAGLSVDDVDLWEFNEAFSSVGINSMRALGLTSDNVNVNGGAVALGHPLGASGARIVGSLVLELNRRGGGIGVAGICSGGGQGDAIIVRVG